MCFLDNVASRAFMEMTASKSHDLLDSLLVECKIGNSWVKSGLVNY
jgi:hypothetical protein